MTCRSLGGGVIACGPPPGVYRRAIMHCPVCERRRRAIIRWDGAWYGTTNYCACGDRWQDGEMAPRPFQKGWRKEAQQRFREMWQNAAPRNLYYAYVDADCRFAMSNDALWEQACADRDAALSAITERRSA